MKKRRGFTLIELLVTISIVAILTTLLTVNFVGARQRGRDGQRKANLLQMQSALELYRSDNGEYPTASQLSNCGAPLSSGGTIYMQKLPCDPSTDNAYVYTPSPTGCNNTSSACVTYVMFACLENGQDSERDTTTGICTSPNVPYRLTNP